MPLVPKYQTGNEIDVTSQVAGKRLDQPTQTWFDNYYRKPTLQDQYLQSLYDYLKKKGKGTTVQSTQPTQGTGQTGAGISADNTSIGGPSVSLTPATGGSATTAGGAGTTPATEGNWYGQPIFKVDPTQGIARDTSLDGNINLPSNGAWTFDVDRSALGTPPVIDSRTAGNNRQDAASKFKQDAENRFKITPDRGMPNLRPVPDILNYIISRNHINRIEKLGLSRKEFRIPVTRKFIPTVKDFSPEMLAKMESDKYAMRALNPEQGAGWSDPASMMIAKNMNASQRRAFEESGIVERAKHIADQREKQNLAISADVDSQAAQQAAAIDRDQAFSDRKLAVRTAAEEARKGLDSNFLSSIGPEWMDKPSVYNKSRQPMMLADIDVEYNNKLKAAALISDWSKREVALNEAKTWYETARKNPEEYASAHIPTYRESAMGWADGSFLDRFFERRNNPRLKPRSA